MSKLAHSNQETMEEIEARDAIEPISIWPCSINLLKELREDQMTKKPIEVTGIWLDAHSGRIRVRAEIDGEWRTVIDETNGDGHISHIVEPASMTKAKPSVELK